MNRTDRLYALVEELRAVAPRPRSAGWLAKRFEVSTRTVERDIAALQQSGVPIWADTVGAAGTRWTGRARCRRWR
ncbi:HTH domain-containing protein [Saccharopolyspora gregorii]|uniref:Helix-turn-helix type 11 domain-containing protein n=1 Tax=Saccharopolyspora gregorii TaxID=33914 RepID=A0ABP6RIQ9_9PSEU